MTDRTGSAAFAALPLAARRTLSAIEAAIGDRSSASVSRFTASRAGACR
jgi:hypothetical protein